MYPYLRFLLLSLMLGTWFGACGHHKSSTSMQNVRTSVSDDGLEKNQKKVEDKKIMQIPEDDNKIIVSNEVFKQEDSSKKIEESSNDDSNILDTSIAGSVIIDKNVSKLVDLTAESILNVFFFTAQKSEIKKSSDPIFIDVDVSQSENKSLVGQFDIMLPIENSQYNSGHMDSGFNLVSAEKIKECDILVFYFIKCSSDDKSSIGLMVLDSDDNKGKIRKISERKIAVKYMCPGYYQSAKNCSEEKIRKHKSYRVEQSPKNLYKKEKETLQHQNADQKNMNILDDISLDQVSEITEGEDPVVVKEISILDKNEEDKKIESEKEEKENDNREDGHKKNEEPKSQAIILDENAKNGHHLIAPNEEFESLQENEKDNIKNDSPKEQEIIGNGNSQSENATEVKSEHSIKSEIRSDADKFSKSVKSLKAGSSVSMPMEESSLGQGVILPNAIDASVIENTNVKEEEKSESIEIQDKKTIENVFSSFEDKLEKNEMKDEIKNSVSARPLVAKPKKQK